LGRFLLFVLALALATAGLYALVSGPRLPLSVASGPPPLDEIDAESRARLDRVLRAADGEQAQGRAPAEPRR